MAAIMRHLIMTLFIMHLWIPCGTEVRILWWNLAAMRHIRQTKYEMFENGMLTDTGTVSDGNQRSLNVELQISYRWWILSDYAILVVECGRFSEYFGMACFFQTITYTGNWRCALQNNWIWGEIEWKNWKTVLAGLFIFCLLICAPLAVFAEEDGVQQEEETEEPVPESYDYPIESNEIKDWPQVPR